MYDIYYKVKKDYKSIPFTETDCHWIHFFIIILTEISVTAADFVIL